MHIMHAWWHHYRSAPQVNQVACTVAASQLARLLGSLAVVLVRSIDCALDSPRAAAHPVKVQACTATAPAAPWSRPVQVQEKFACFCLLQIDTTEPGAYVEKLARQLEMHGLY